MKTIVALTDFSDDSVNAVFYAADMAVLLKCRLIVFNVSYIPTVPAMSIMPSSVDNWLYDETKQMTQLEGQIKFHVNDLIPVSTVIRDGNINEEIKGFCADQQPLTVMMGPESIPSFERFFIQGQTLMAINELPWPVMIIPPGARFHGYKKIGFACDLKNVVATTPFLPIKTMVSLFHAELHILHVADDDSFEPRAIEEAGWLEDIFHGINIEFHFIGGDDAPSIIASFAEKNEIDLLVIVPKHHSFLEKLFHKSLSKDIVLESRLPVFCIHE